MAIVAVIVLLLAVAAPARASEFARFPIADPQLVGTIAQGPDGAIWFAGEHGVGRLGPDGKLSVLARGTLVNDLATGPDGNLWLALDGAIGRLTPAGALTRFPVAAESVETIVPGPDGALWFTDGCGMRIGRITTSGAASFFPRLRDPSGDSCLWALHAGPDGNVWFVSDFALGSITPAGLVRWLPPQTDIQSLGATIATGPDGNLWVAGMVFDAVLKVTPAGTVTRIPAPEGADSLIFDPDGSMWVGGFEPLTRIAMDGRVLERSHDPFGDAGDCGDASDAPGDGFARDAAGQLWAADLLGGSLVRLGSAPGAPPGPVTALLPNRAPYRTPHAMTTAPDGSIWIATDTAFVRARPGEAPRVVRGYSGPGVIDVAAARDGTLWFTDYTSRIGRLTPSGALRYSKRAGRRGSLGGIALDARGDPWFVLNRRIGRLHAGKLQRFRRGIPRRSHLLDIAAGPHGRMWFTDQDGRIGRIDARGRVRLFRSGKAKHRAPVAIVRGTGDEMWFTDFEGRVGRISQAGRVREYRTGEAPTAIAAAPDGSLWFTIAQSEFYAGVGRVTPDGRVSFYHVRHTCETIPWGIAAAPDGRIWFAESHGPVAVGVFDPAAAP
jgi:virginiamycin B lyase